MRETWVEKIPWRRERLPTLLFWPGEFHGLYSPWGRKESDMTEWLSLHFWEALIIQIPPVLEDQLSGWMLSPFASPPSLLSNPGRSEKLSSYISYIRPSPSLHTCCLRMGRPSSLRAVSLPSAPQCSTQGLIWGFLLTLPHRLSPLPPWVLKVCGFGGSRAEENRKTEINSFWEKERKNSLQLDTSFIGFYWATCLKK